MSTALTIALATWGVGVQLNELVAAIGCYATTVLLLISVRPSLAALRRWWPLLAFVGWGLVVPPWPTGTGLARLSDWLLVPVAAAAVTRVKLRPVLVAAGVTAALSCLAAALQHFGLWPSQQALAPLAFTKIPFHRVYEPIEGTGRFMAGGLAFHRLRFGNVTGLVVVCAAAIAVHRRHARAAALAVVGFVSVAVFPAARAAAAALALALATLVKPRWIAAAIIAVAALAGIWTRPGGERLGLLQAGLEAVKAHPLRGVGVGRFVPGDWAAPDAPAQVKEHAGKSHNQLLTLAAEGGVVHALSFIGLLALIARRLIAAPAGEARSAGLAGLVFFVLLSFLHDPLFHAVTSQALVLVFGGCLGLASRDQTRAPPPW